MTEEVFKPLLIGTDYKFIKVKHYKERLILEIHFKDKSVLYFFWRLNRKILNENYTLGYSHEQKISYLVAFNFENELEISPKMSLRKTVLPYKFSASLISLNLSNLKRLYNRHYVTLFLLVCKHMNFWIKDLKIYIFNKFIRGL